MSYVSLVNKKRKGGRKIALVFLCSRTTALFSELFEKRRLVFSEKDFRRQRRRNKKEDSGPRLVHPTPPPNRPRDDDDQHHAGAYGKMYVRSHRAESLGLRVSAALRQSTSTMPKSVLKPSFHSQLSMKLLFLTCWFWFWLVG
jgi:hypothetical protein